MGYDTNPSLPPGRPPAPETWDEYADGVRKWVSAQWGADHKCPYCGHPDWHIGEVVSLASVPNWPSEPGSAPGHYPVAQLICRTCGHTVLVNAVYIFQHRRPK
jgi:5-methylcytosine-specific restriction endonuclease McrA